MRKRAARPTVAFALTAALIGGCGTDDEPGVVDDVDEAIADETDISREELEEDAEEAVEDVTEDAGAVLADPQAYVGEDVSLETQVDEVLGDGLFAVSGPDTSTNSLLVLSGDGPGLQQGSNVTIEGTLEESFDVAEAEEMLGADLDDVSFERFAGEAFLRAETVSQTTSP